MRFQRRHKPSEFKGASVLPNHIDLGGVYKQYCKRKYRQVKLLQSTEFVKIRLDKSSAVVVEVASFVLIFQ